MSKNSSSAPVPAAPVVEAAVGGHRVKIGKRTHFVNKRRQCSCHNPNCPAIAAVAGLLAKRGDHRAPVQTAVASLPPVSADRVETAPHTFACPICGAEASGSLERRQWVCSADSKHPYVWWVDQIRAKQVAFKQRWSPYTREVMKAFASDRARAEFLEQHRLTYPAQA